MRLSTKCTFCSARLATFALKSALSFHRRTLSDYFSLNQSGKAVAIQYDDSYGIAISYHYALKLLNVVTFIRV